VGTPADPSQPFQIPLQVGWNLIGNPFTFEVNWSQVQFIDPDTNTAVSLPTAVGKGIVANALWGYSFGSYAAVHPHEDLGRLLGVRLPRDDAGYPAERRRRPAARPAEV
jgi:hypothetical protein